MKRDVDQLKRLVPMHAIVSRYLELREENGEYIGLCPFHEEKTPSFKVYKAENDREWFKCFGCAEHGDVVTFISKIEQCDVPTAIAKLEEMVKEQAATNAENWNKKSAPVSAAFHSIKSQKEKLTLNVAFYNSTYERALANKPEAVKWLKDERGLSLDAAQKMHFGFSQEVFGKLEEKYEPLRKKGWITFPRIVGDKIVSLKFRSIAGKAFTQMAGMQSPSELFNVETISPFEPIFVTEGEFDTAVLEQAGFRAVSIPAASTSIKPESKKILKSAEMIFLAGDNDGKVGTLCMQRLARELEDNTYVIKWDGVKDANEFFLKKCGGDVAAFRSAIQRAMMSARATPVQEFTSLIERLLTAGDIDAANDPHRAHFPWADVDAMNYTPAGGVIVVYSTYSGTGKTVWSTEWMLFEASRGEVVVVYSPELRDAQYLALVASQTLGRTLGKAGLPRDKRITREQFERTAALLDKPTENGNEFQFYVGHQLPVSEPGAVVKFIEEVVKVTGATRFVIDTIHRVVEKQPRESQAEAEGRVVKEIERIGLKYNCTFILIGQSNKEAEGIKESNRDELGVLRGCRELTDVSYGVYLLHRKRINQKDSDATEILENKCDVHLKKDRGRGPGKAMVSLLYNRSCSNFLQYTGRNVEDEFPGTMLKKKPTGDEDSAY